MSSADLSSFSQWAHDYVDENFPDGDVPAQLLSFISHTADFVDLTAMLGSWSVQLASWITTPPTAAQVAAVEAGILPITQIAGAIGIAGAIAFDINRVLDAIDCGKHRPLRSGGCFRKSADGCRGRLRARFDRQAAGRLRHTDR
jgi:hypothetical protein